jgi:tetratricopeptide (TPR) repeat protein
VHALINNLGNVLEDLGDYQGAKEHYERALAIDEEVYGPDHLEVAGDFNNLGNVLEDLGDYQGAKEHYERALSIYEHIDPNHPNAGVLREEIIRISERLTKS